MLTRTQKEELVVTLREKFGRATSIIVADYCGLDVKQATALGADPASVYVPHPIQDRSDEEIRDLADLAFDRVVDRLVGG